ncbi:CDP-glycerol glycerophosphotransferase family protein [Curtanaerobium respiraculi]|uniref:CDP-glycerol glycerophosphotransferase family protein n=1 Tax=Curtanaerobium respiraculi TaxID=2949669 RepID=UPI0024B372BC|nr:CDP-glycerol glycerophosphotransferase family protein [Curtanaerobium respiraculi]
MQSDIKDALAAAVPDLARLYRRAANRYAYFHARRQFRLEKERVQPGVLPVKVCFLMQYVQAWNKFESLYALLLADERTRPVIVCVPNDLGCAPDENDVLRFFQGKGYECVNAKQSDGSWLDLRELNCAYTFYSRPYNVYLPRCYRSSVVSSYSKVCNILYGMHTNKTQVAPVMNKDFYAYCYCYYASTSEDLEFYQSDIQRNTAQRSIFLGYPGVTNMVERKDSADSGAWGNHTGQFKVIWTPRWSTDPVVGGSNFLVYEKLFLDLAQRREDVCFLFRPHPLTFPHFVKTGEMTAEQVKEYRRACRALSNVVLDESGEYAASFWSSNALVTDISGVLFEYFVTGKPVVFCPPTGIGAPDYVETLNRMLDGMYIAHTFDEVSDYVTMLSAGEDPLRDMRREIIEEIWGDTLSSAPQLILEDIISDAARQ